MTPASPCPRPKVRLALSPVSFHQGQPRADIPSETAITAYLVQKHDRDARFTPTDSKDRSRVVVWASFANSELGPSSVNAIEFYRRRGDRPELAFAAQHFI